MPRTPPDQAKILWVGNVPRGNGLSRRALRKLFSRLLHNEVKRVDIRGQPAHDYDCAIVFLRKRMSVKEAQRLMRKQRHPFIVRRCGLRKNDDHQNESVQRDNNSNKKRSPSRTPPGWELRFSSDNPTPPAAVPTPRAIMCAMAAVEAHRYVAENSSPLPEEVRPGTPGFDAFLHELEDAHIPFPDPFFPCPFPSNPFASFLS